MLVDIDDTLKSSGGYRLFNIPLGGIDTQYERGEYYPGTYFPAVVRHTTANAALHSNALRFVLLRSLTAVCSLTAAPCAVCTAALLCFLSGAFQFVLELAAYRLARTVRPLPIAVLTARLPQVRGNVTDARGECACCIWFCSVGRCCYFGSWECVLEMSHSPFLCVLPIPLLCISSPSA